MPNRAHLSDRLHGILCTIIIMNNWTCWFVYTFKCFKSEQMRKFEFKIPNCVVRAKQLIVTGKNNRFWFDIISLTILMKLKIQLNLHKCGSFCVFVTHIQLQPTPVGNAWQKWQISNHARHNEKKTRTHKNRQMLSRWLIISFSIGTEIILMDTSVKKIAFEQASHNQNKSNLKSPGKICIMFFLFVSNTQYSIRLNRIIYGYE